MDINKYVTVSEAAETLGYTEQYIRQLARDREFFGVERFGRAWMIPRKEVEDYKAKHPKQWR